MRKQTQGRCFLGPLVIERASKLKNTFQEANIVANAPPEQSFHEKKGVQNLAILSLIAPRYSRSAFAHKYP